MEALIAILTILLIILSLGFLGVGISKVMKSYQKGNKVSKYYLFTYVILIAILFGYWVGQ
jgi:VIT1/CCC1 family predicted Fe2+/Mn2+ transporter